MNFWINYKMSNISSVGVNRRGRLSDVVEKIIEEESHPKRGVFIQKMWVSQEKDHV